MTRTLLQIERDLAIARSNDDIVDTPATRAYVAQLERERAKVLIEKRDNVQRMAKKL